MEGKILNLQISQRPSAINSPEQTLRRLSPAAATDQQPTFSQITVKVKNRHIADLVGIGQTN